MSPFELEFAAQWADWIAPLAWQATLIGLVALTVDRSSLRRTRPEFASAVWWLFFARLALPPGLSSPISVSERAFTATWTPIASASTPSSMLGVAFAFWFAVAVALLARGSFATRRFARSLDLDFESSPSLALELERARMLLGLRRAPRVAIATELDSPCVLGLLRPLVVVPRELVCRGDRRALNHSLLHELAHLRRRDPLSRAVCELLTALFWFHPLAWLGAARLARTRELLCDARVVEVLGDERDAYRLSLAEAARGKLLARSGALAFHSGSSRILERLAHLERPLRNGARRRLGTLAATFCAGCVLLPMASRNAEFTAVARNVFEKSANGERQSCFVLQAATQLLADEQSKVSENPQGDRQ